MLPHEIQRICLEGWGLTITQRPLNKLSLFQRNQNVKKPNHFQIIILRWCLVDLSAFDCEQQTHLRNLSFKCAVGLFLAGLILPQNARLPEAKHSHSERAASPNESHNTFERLVVNAYGNCAACNHLNNMWFNKSWILLIIPYTLVFYLPEFKRFGFSGRLRICGHKRQSTSRFPWEPILGATLVDD